MGVTMNVLEWINQSEFVTAVFLILVPNIAAAIIASLLLKRIKTYEQLRHRIAVTIFVFVFVANLVGIFLMSVFNPDRSFYWFDESEGGTWAFTILPTSILLALLTAALYERKVAS